MMRAIVVATLFVCGVLFSVVHAETTSPTIQTLQEEKALHGFAGIQIIFDPSTSHWKVKSVYKGSPAARVHVAVGDILVSINGEELPPPLKPVTDTAQGPCNPRPEMRLLKGDFRAGENARYVFERRGKRIVKTITLKSLTSVVPVSSLTRRVESGGASQRKGLKCFCNGCYEIIHEDPDMTIYCAHAGRVLMSLAHFTPSEL